MEMNYKPNSHKYKTEVKEKRVERVVKGGVKTKKKKGLTKLADIFIANEVSDVKSYILMDVLLPTIKKTIFDIITDSADMILNGGTGNRKRSGSSKISYNRYYDRDRRDEPRSTRYNRFTIDDIILDSRTEAEEVIYQLEGLIDTYKLASVADLYDLVGITCEFTDNKYGWTNIRNAEVVRVRDGWMLKLPRALPIN